MTRRTLFASIAAVIAAVVQLRIYPTLSTRWQGEFLEYYPNGGYTIVLGGFDEHGKARHFLNVLQP